MDVETLDVVDRLIDKAYIAEKNINLIFNRAKKDRRKLTKREWELVFYFSNVVGRLKLRSRVLLSL